MFPSCGPQFRMQRFCLPQPRYCQPTPCFQPLQQQCCQPTIIQNFWPQMFSGLGQFGGNMFNQFGGMMNNFFNPFDIFGGGMPPFMGGGQPPVAQPVKKDNTVWWIAAAAGLALLLTGNNRPEQGVKAHTNGTLAEAATTQNTQAETT